LITSEGGTTIHQINVSDQSPKKPQFYEVYYNNCIEKKIGCWFHRQFELVNWFMVYYIGSLSLTHMNIWKHMEKRYTMNVNVKNVCLKSQIMIRLHDI
jgi:hypothetical protein